MIACNGAPDPPPVQQPPPPAVPPDVGPAAGSPPFALALWPGEGIPQFEAVGRPLALRTAPRAAAAVHDTLHAESGARLPYDSTSYQTVRAVSIAVLRPDTISGRDFGAVRELSREQYQSSVAVISLPVSPTSQLLLLQHRAEGTCFVAVDDRIIEADPCPVFDSGAFRPDGDPGTEWWIFVPGAAHGGGWVVVSDSTVRVAGRGF
jgi:hypothetical protein